MKEVDIGLAADIGTLQRFPKGDHQLISNIFEEKFLILFVNKVSGNDSLVRELVYTARKFTADEAFRLGLVSQVYPDQESLINGALETAKLVF